MLRSLLGCLLLSALVLGCYKYEERVWQTPNRPAAPGGPTAPPNPNAPPEGQPAAPVNRLFLDNVRVRVGIDLTLGGAITFLSEGSNGPNIVNNRDFGRQIQTGLYGGPIPYTRGTKRPIPQLEPLGWNPVQAGDYYFNASRVLEYRQLDSARLYVRTAPLFWPLRDEPADCVMEHWLEVRENTVRVRSRTTINRADTTQYEARGQESPAVYVNGPYTKVVSYTGDQPFTNGALREWNFEDQIEAIYGSENWVAIVNRQGRGVGLWQPRQYDFYGAFFGKPGAGGEFDNPTGYITGTITETLDHNAIFEYEYVIVVGTVEDVRRFAYQQTRPTFLPNYRFTDSRQRWYYRGTRDQGIPVRNELNVRLGRTDLRVASPTQFWRAQDVPKLYVRGAFRTSAQRFRLSWRLPSEMAFIPKADRYIDFPITGDGQVRTYEINLAGVPGWQGVIAQLSLEPVPGQPTATGDWLRLQAVTAEP